MCYVWCCPRDAEGEVQPRTHTCTSTQHVKRRRLTREKQRVRTGVGGDISKIEAHDVEIPICRAIVFVFVVIVVADIVTRALVG